MNKVKLCGENIKYAIKVLKPFFREIFYKKRLKRPTNETNT